MTMPSTADSGSRAVVISVLAERVADRRLLHPTRVAVDGITASGKSTLARELTDAITSLGRPAIQLSMDGFHHPRARRHSQGRESAIGYREDAYDLNALAREVLIPLGPGGNRRYRSSIIDLPSDQPTNEPQQTAPANTVLIVDGTFLQSPELLEHWDERIWVNTTFPVARNRGSVRDAQTLGGQSNAERLFDVRYHEACRLYVDAAQPAGRATAVFENDDLNRPTVRFWSSDSRA
jgi:uridine kinase